MALTEKDKEIGRKLHALMRALVAAHQPDMEIVVRARESRSLLLESGSPDKTDQAKMRRVAGLLAEASMRASQDADGLNPGEQVTETEIMKWNFDP